MHPQIILVNKFLCTTAQSTVFSKNSRNFLDPHISATVQASN